MARRKRGRGSAPNGEFTQQALTETAAGVKVRLEYYENVDDGGREEFRLDQIRAMKDGLELGYLKICYIDQERFKKYAATPFEYRMHFQNHYLAMKHLLEDGVSQEDWTEEQLRRMLFDAHPGYAPSELQRSWEEKTHQELLEELDTYITKANNTYHEQWEDFKEHAVDRPHVDFIRTYTETDLTDFKGKPLPNVGKGSGMALGQLLYEAGAEWLNERGLYLYGSTIQSPDAEKAWERLAEKHSVGRISIESNYSQTMERKYLDGSEITIPGQKIDMRPKRVEISKPASIEM